MATYYEYNSVTGFLIGTYEVPPNAIRPNSTLTNFAPIPPIRARWNGAAWVNDPAQENQLAADAALFAQQPWGAFARFGNLTVLTAAGPLAGDSTYIVGNPASATYALPVAPPAGTRVFIGAASFSVVGHAQATLDAGVGVPVAGRTRFLVLTHGTSVLLVWTGSIWSAAFQRLDSLWADGGTITFGATTAPPTKGTTTRDKQWFARFGQDLLLRYEYRQTTAGTDGTGIYLFTLPGGFQADTSVLQTNNTVNDFEAYGITVGNSRWLRGADSHTGAPSMWTATQFRCSGLHLANPVATSDNVSINSAIGLGNANVRFSLQARIPILNW